MVITTTLKHKCASNKKKNMHDLKQYGVNHVNQHNTLRKTQTIDLKQLSSRIYMYLKSLVTFFSKYLFKYI